MKLAFIHVHYFLGSRNLGWHLKAPCKSKCGCEEKVSGTEAVFTVSIRNWHTLWGFMSIWRDHRWWRIWVRSLGWEDPLEEGMATHSSILAWRIPWTEEPGGLQSLGLQSWTRPTRQHSTTIAKFGIRNGFPFDVDDFCPLWRWPLSLLVFISCSLFQQIFIENFLHVSHLGKTVGNELYRIPSQYSSFFKDR